jgi:glycosyltransferase involved in cell wall biosynthesis
MKSQGITPAKPAALIVGPTPPPYNGMSIANEFVQSSVRDAVRVIHLDIADRRGLANVGRLDLTNIVLAAAHGVKCVWLLLKEKPEVVYVPIAQAWLPFLRDCLFLVPARIARRRVIVHLHGNYFNRFYRQTPGVMRAIIRYALGRASIAIVLGKSGSGLFDGILPAQRIRIVPNGIPDYFQDGTARTGGVQKPVLLYLGLLSANKGTLHLLQALAAIKQEFPEARTIFAGEWASGKEKLAAGRIIEEFGLASIVEFVGPVGLDQKLELFRNADVFVFPSADEGHPYAILEAMSAGLPIVSTNIACIPETVEDGKSGFLTEPGDVDGLVDRVGRLLRDGALRGRMGTEARKRFLEEYTLDRYAERMNSVFAEALRKTG